MRGTVTQVIQQGKRIVLEIDGQWYSSFVECDVVQGDLVEFDYKTVKKDGKTYRNIQSIRRIESEPVAMSEAERIARAVALKAAVRSCSSESTVEEVLAVAQHFLDFLLDRHS